MALKHDIQALARQLGVAAIGFAVAQPIADDHSQALEQFVADGRHGTMAFLERYGHLRRDPRPLLEPAPAATVISIAVGYDTGQRHSHIASYALTPDYHHTLRALVAPICQLIEQHGGATRVCVDSAPVAERYWAQRSGVGWICRNHQLYVPGWGQRVFLVEILTDIPMEADAPLTGEHPCAGACGDEARCRAACPAGALRHAAFDARQCLSYLTIEHRGALAPGTRLHGRWYGCDACLNACPLNSRPAPSSPLAVDPGVSALTADALEGLTRGAYKRLTQQSAMARASLAQLLRNLRNG